LNIVRIEPISLVDWPGEIASVIHVKGCNFKCSWCFNKEIVDFDMNGITNIGIKGVVASIPKQIHHVIITGGEPFAQNGIIDFIHKLRAIGYKVGVHTNGSFPLKLDKVIYALDYVAQDIKGYIDMYHKRGFCSAKDTTNVMNSLYVITDSTTPHEFRTTAFPGIKEKEIFGIANMLKILNADAYYLQPYIPVNGENKRKYLSANDLKDIAQKISNTFEASGHKTKVIARG